MFALEYYEQEALSEELSLRRSRFSTLRQRREIRREPYIMPMPAPPCGIGGSGSLICVMPASVVSSMLATEAAFCRADLVTFTGSTIPAAIISSYVSFAALNPTLPSAFLTSATTTAPSNPAFSAICLTGSSRALSTILAPVFTSPSC